LAELLGGNTLQGHKKGALQAPVDGEVEGNVEVADEEDFEGHAGDEEGDGENVEANAFVELEFTALQLQHEARDENEASAADAAGGELFLEDGNADANHEDIAELVEDQDLAVVLVLAQVDLAAVEAGVADGGTGPEQEGAGTEADGGGAIEEGDKAEADGGGGELGEDGGCAGVVAEAGDALLVGVLQA